MKLACIGPLSPLKTGISQFSENLLPYLAEHSDIKLFSDAYPPSPTPILRRFPSAHISDFFSESSAFDAVLYHMGNHYEYHRNVFETLCRVPGIVLLHDCVLNHFFSKYFLERGNFGAFRSFLKSCYPGLDKEKIEAFFKVKGDPYQYPMAGIISKLARGTIVMNEYGRNIVQDEAPAARVLKINQPYFPPDEIGLSTEIVRERFGIPGDYFVVSSVGHMTPAKRIDVALEGFCRFHEEFPNSVFLLAGQLSGQLHLRDMVARSSSKGVRYLGYISNEEFDGLMKISDVLINLRYPSNGEMSATLLHMLGRGKVAIVSNYAQFAELPDEVCVKIDLGPNEADELSDELLGLAGDVERRNRIGKAAGDCIENDHAGEAAAEAIIEFAEDVLRVDPIFSQRDIGDLLRPDVFPTRSRQLVAYNGRRFRRHFSEQGLLPTLRHAVREIFTGKL